MIPIICTERDAGCCGLSNRSGAGVTDKKVKRGTSRVFRVDQRGQRRVCNAKGRTDLGNSAWMDGVTL